MTSPYTLITGGTTGIGYAAAKHLIALGHKVIITGQNENRVDRAAIELGCEGVVADSASIEDINALANNLKRRKITLTGVVLNAGIFQPALISEATEAQFDHTFNVNVKGPLFTLKALLPCLAKPSSVVFVSSIVVEKSYQGCSIYSASKAASEAIMAIANIELAEAGVRVNMLRPGVTETEIHRKTGMADDDRESFFNSMARIPLGRALVPDDHIDTIAFLLSDASLAMRNAVIKVDGGDVL